MRFPITLLFLACGVMSPLSAAIGVKKITDGFHRPVWVGMPKVSKKQLWVMEQNGVVTAVEPVTGQKVELFRIEDRVSRQGNEEGLLGLAFSPDFETSGRFYLNYTDKEHFTCISRMVIKNGKVDVSQEEVVLRYKQDFLNHNGGWIEFGPDKMLYIGNGDGGSGNDPKQRAQDLSSLLGKILRIDVSPAKGYKVPADNPFVGKEKAIASIYTYGNRNPQGMAMDPVTGLIWENEHGPRGGDELNIIKAGTNYGWPVISYGINYDGKPITPISKKEGMQQPVTYWIPSIAPSGLAFVTGDKYPAWKGSLMVGSLRFSYLNRCIMKENKVVGEEKVLLNIGRLRNIEMGRDGYLYVSVEGPGNVFRLMPVK
jgi:glucose/arabinose dehydrogenase